MESIKPRTLEDIHFCVDMYLKLNDETFIPADKQLAYDNLSNLVRRNKFVRMAIKDDKIIGWIYATPGLNLHTKEKILQQSYFCSNQTGISAARVIKFLHQELIEEAKTKELKGIVWQVLDWNEKAIQFYQKYASSFDSEWINCSLTTEQINSSNASI